jgi:hypothetical protein
MASAANERPTAPPASSGTANIRRSDFDITNTVRVSSATAVLQAVEQLFASTWPEVATEPLRLAFAQFDTPASTRSTTTVSTPST